MSRKVLFEGKYLRLISRNSWEYVERIRATGIVVICGINEEGKVILVEQYRPAVDKKVIEFPAGLMNDEKGNQHENFETTARRELMEETGYEAKKLTFLIGGPHAAGSSSALVYFFQAFGLKKTAQGGGDEYEKISVHEVPLAKVQGWLKQMERKGYMVDPKVYSGLYFLETRKSQKTDNRSQKTKDRRQKK